MWGCMPGIPELARLRQNDNLEAKASLSCLETLCLETKTKIKKTKKPKNLQLFRGQHRCSPHFPNGESEASLERLRHRLKKRVFSSGPWLHSQAAAWLGGRAPRDMRLSGTERLTEFLRPHFKVAWKANHAFS